MISNFDLPSLLKDFEKCPICLDKMEEISFPPLSKQIKALDLFLPSKHLIETPCDNKGKKHLFHRVCASSWFEKNNPCPLCKKDIGVKIRATLGLKSLEDRKKEALENVFNKLAQQKAEIEDLNELEEMDVDLNSRISNGLSLIHQSIKYRNLPLTLALVNAGADINILTSDGSSVLHLAAEFESNPLLLTMLSLSADIHIKNHYGYTVLHILTSQGRTELISEMLKQGANPNEKDERGRTPLDIAEEKGLTEIVALMRRY